MVCCCFSALIHSGCSSGGTSLSMILYYMFVLCITDLYGQLLYLGIDPFCLQQWWHKLVYNTILYVCTVRYRSVWSVAVSRHWSILGTAVVAQACLWYDTILYVCTVCYRAVWSVAVSRHWSILGAAVVAQACLWYYTICLYCALQICMVSCCISALIHSGYSNGGISLSTILYYMFVLCVTDLYGQLLFLSIDPFWVQQWWHKLVYNTILYVCTVCYRSVWSIAISRHWSILGTAVVAQAALWYYTVCM